MAADLDALMARVATGDERAFGELYDELAPTVYGLVVRVVGEPAESEAVTKAAFVELWRRAAQFDSPRGGVRGWAVSIAHRRAVAHLRSRQARRVRPHHTAPSPAPSTVDVLHHVGPDQRLTRLGATQRRALELAYFDGLTHVGVAEQLGIADRTAKTLIRDGLIRLRNLQEPHAS